MGMNKRKINLDDSQYNGTNHPPRISRYIELVVKWYKTPEMQC